MQVKSIAECKGSFLQYVRPSLSYHLSLGSLFCQFWSGHLTQVLLYFDCGPMVGKMQFKIKFMDTRVRPITIAYLWALELSALESLHGEWQEISKKQHVIQLSSFIFVSSIT